MEWLKSWLTAVTCAALAAALADALSPPGLPRRLAHFAGGLLILLAVLAPVRRLDEAELSQSLAKYRMEYEGYSEAFAAENEERMKSIIEEQTSAYISDKATALGIKDCQVTVQCRMVEGGFPAPEQVTVRGAGGEERAWQDLSRAITADFAVPPENQTLERTDVP